MARPIRPTPSAPHSCPAKKPGRACPASEPSPRQGRDSSYRGRDSDFALHRGRKSDFAFLPEKPIAGPAPKVRQRCCPRSIADGVFFSPFTRPTVNPGVGTGLPHSILAWAQDCPTQSWRGHRIATLNPGVGTGLPRFFPRKRWKRSAVQHYAPRLAARLPGFKFGK